MHTTRTEHCQECQTETEHEVRLVIDQENQRSDEEGHSREPYRVSECQRCGRTDRQRMNNQESAT